jgi:hypothetical protein
MSTTIRIYLRTTQTAAAIEETLREHLRTKNADPTRYWIQIRPADTEAREGGREDFGVEPSVVISIQPPRGEGDGALSAAVLATAHGTGSEMVALHDYAPLFSYRAGVAHFPSDSREFYEEDVLPGFTGQVEWGSVLPWMPA